MRRAPRAFPLEYCYGDGVVLDLTHKGAGDEITVSDIEEAERKLGGYRIKALDIVLLRTDAAKKRFEKTYLTDHPGMTKESVHYILDRGVKVMGIDAIGFDPPVAKMFERKKFWEAHRVMREREYYHLENLCNLHEIPALPLVYRERAADQVARRVGGAGPRGGNHLVIKSSRGGVNTSIKTESSNASAPCGTLDGMGSRSPARSRIVSPARSKRIAPDASMVTCSWM